VLAKFDEICLFQTKLSWVPGLTACCGFGKAGSLKVERLQKHQREYPRRPSSTQMNRKRKSGKGSASALTSNPGDGPSRSIHATLKPITTEEEKMGFAWVRICEPARRVLDERRRCSEFSTLQLGRDGSEARKPACHAVAGGALAISCQTSLSQNAAGPERGVVSFRPCRVRREMTRRTAVNIRLGERKHSALNWMSPSRN